MQIKGVVPSSSCCAGGVPARWRGDSRDGKQPPRELFHPRRRAVSCEAALRILSNGESCPPCGGDSGMTMGGRDSFAVGLGAVAGACVDHGSGQARMPPQSDGTRIAFCFCGLWEVLCVSLRAVAGAGMRSRASRDAFPSGAWERHRFNGGAVAVCFEGLLRGHVLAAGAASHACRRGSGCTRGFNFLFWGLFHMLGRGWHERVRGGGFNPLRGATTGVVMRRRATSGEMARGGLVFVFSLEVAPVSEGDSFTRSGVVRHACRLRRDGTRIAFCFCGLWEVLCVSLMAVAGAGMRSRASRDAFPSGAWERHRFNGGAVAVCFEGCCGRGG